MCTCSAREYTMFTPAHLLCDWYEQWPSNQGDLDLCHGKGWESLLHGGGPASDFIFILQCIIIFGLHFKWYTL
jgi:hypothetical protein